LTITLTAGDAAATVHPDDGGRLGQIRVRDRRLLRGPDDAAHLGWGFWGCYPLLPWSNRIPGGAFEHEGHAYKVPVNWTDGAAIHGLTAEAPWTPTDVDETTAEEIIDVDVGPYVVRGRQRFALTPTHLDLTLEVVNNADHSVPVGLGIHPWFVAGAIRVPAALAWPGEGPLPEGTPQPVTGDIDLRELRIPPTMDRCYTGLTGSSADVPGLTVEWSGPVTQVVVYTGEPGWVCVEPVTMASNGFRLVAEGVDGTGVIALAPGESTAVHYRFRWS
jgi:aldose 1-epimerase